MSNDIGISNLIVEVTRRCNMECFHCARGDTEPIDINLQYIDTLFQKVNGIWLIAFTGGEPSLVPHLISEIVDIAESYIVEFSDFYIATNGKKITPEFIMAITKLYCYCSDNEISQIQWSNTPYHEDVSPENIRFLDAFKFYSPKYSKEFPFTQKEKYIVAEGRARDWGKRTALTGLSIEEDNITEGEIYLNCEGNIIAGCNWSYESQRNPENIICSVDEFSLEKVEEFITKNTKEEERLCV